MFPRLPPAPRVTFVAETKFLFETQNMFLIFFKNILCPQQMFLGLLTLVNMENGYLRLQVFERVSLNVLITSE